MELINCTEFSKTNNIEKSKQELITEINRRIDDKIIEQANADLLKKLINNADTLTEAIAIAELGTTYKRTGFHFDKRLEKTSDTIKYFKKNENLSFKTNDDDTTHKLIIGDNYDALLNLLVEYRGKIDVIYIDPPYGKDKMGEFANTNYENAITRDNLLSMLYPRLILAKELLSNNGVIFCSIDNRNHAYVKCLFDEIFEEKNYIDSIVWDKKASAKGVPPKNMIVNVHEYIVTYQKSDGFKFIGKERSEKSDGFKNPDNDPRGLWRESNIKSTTKTNEEAFTIVDPNTGKEYTNTWAFSKESLDKMIKENRILWKHTLPKQKEFMLEMTNSNKAIKSNWGVFDAQSTTVYLKKIIPEAQFDNPKPIDLIKHILRVATRTNDIILDFFAGSGTTGQAVLEINKEDAGNRQFLLVTSNEITPTTPNGVVTDITSKRLKRIMSGKCYSHTNNPDLMKHIPLGDNLDVYDIATVANFEAHKDKTPFDVIDETLYGQEKLSVNDKIKWVCENFDGTQNSVENDNTYKKRIGSES